MYEIRVTRTNSFLELFTGKKKKKNCIKLTFFRITMSTGGERRGGFFRGSTPLKITGKISKITYPNYKCNSHFTVFRAIYK